jgi:hypothetical protein
LEIEENVHQFILYGVFSVACATGHPGLPLQPAPTPDPDGHAASANADGDAYVARCDRVELTFNIGDHSRRDSGWFCARFDLAKVIAPAANLW